MTANEQAAINALARLIEEAAFDMYRVRAGTDKFFLCGYTEYANAAVAALDAVVAERTQPTPVTQ